MRTAFAQHTEDAGVMALQNAIRQGIELRAGKITPEQWQDEVEKLLRQCKLPELSRAVELQKSRSRAPSVKRGAAILRVPMARRLLTEDGADVKLFFFKRGYSDPPHCHFNMVAAHIVLEGTFRVRHYARVREEKTGVVLRATHDRTIGPGDVTSISDGRDNAHWHMAETDGVLLDVQQGRLDPSIPIRRRQMLDLDGAIELGGGEILAPHLDKFKALRMYGSP